MKSEIIGFIWKNEQKSLIYFKTVKCTFLSGNLMGLNILGTISYV